MKKDGKKPTKSLSRRTFLKAATGGAAALAGPGCATGFDFEEFLQSHFKEMSKEELKATLDRLEKKYTKKYGKKFSVKADMPIDGTIFGYGLDLSRCIGCRRCVYACVKENNLSRNPQTHWITVLRFKNGQSNFEHATKYYDPEKVPEDGYYYLPVGCQQCDNTPCEMVCPTGATWMDKDGVVVIDYNWCIGCRYCMAACPYGARRFNWSEPNIPKDELNTDTHYLGNRPRYKGVVEKCHFCLQRTRRGKYPACLEICPVGARKFGNLLDPKSEIRYILDNERVFRLKEELNQQPKFYYFFSL